MKNNVPYPQMANDNIRAVIVTPIYKPSLSTNEEVVLRYSLERLRRHDVYFIAPHRLDISFYKKRFDGIRYIFFHDAYFESPHTYSQLLLTTEFYQKFITYSHMLIVQTDAIVLSDDIDRWATGQYDFIGAPWNTPLSITMPTIVDRNAGFSGNTFFISVGNGGFSLRRIQACIDVLSECGWILKHIAMDEDLFFALAGQISDNFLIPNTVCAARFSLEVAPNRFYKLTGHSPMGGHAWERWDRAFWETLFNQHGITGVR